MSKGNINLNNEHLTEFEIEKIVLDNLSVNSRTINNRHLNDCAICNQVYVRLMEFYKTADEKLAQPVFHRIDELVKQLMQTQKIIKLQPFTSPIDENILGGNVFLLSAETDEIETKLRSKTYTFASKEDKLLMRVNVDFENSTANCYLLSDGNISSKFCLVGFTDTENIYRKVTNDAGEIDFTPREKMNWEKASLLIFNPDAEFIFAEKIQTKMDYIAGNFKLHFENTEVGRAQCRIISDAHLKHAAAVYKTNYAALVSISNNLFAIENPDAVKEIKIYV